MFVLKLCQYVFAGDVLARLCLFGLFDNLHFCKEDVAHLLWRRDVKALACLLVDARLNLVHAFT